VDDDDDDDDDDEEKAEDEEKLFCTSSLTQIVRPLHHCLTHGFRQLETPFRPGDASCF
jgi:hypothetical protein